MPDSRACRRLCCPIMFDTVKGPVSWEIAKSSAVACQRSTALLHPCKLARPRKQAHLLPTFAHCTPKHNMLGKLIDPKRLACENSCKASSGAASYPTRRTSHLNASQSTSIPHPVAQNVSRMQTVGKHTQRLPPSMGLPPKQLASELSLDRTLEQPLPEFDSIASALVDIAAGKFVVVLDDEGRENEGDLILAAELATTEAIAFMVEHTSGVLCVTLPDATLKRLKLPLMVSSEANEDAMSTAFTITVDLREGTTTGISASDRAKTLVRLAHPDAAPEEFNRPGHIFPLRARPGGVLVRPGHTEAATDLARLAGCSPAGVLSEIVNKTDGSMQRKPELLAFAKQHGLRCITIADLIRYRLQHDQLLFLTASAQHTVPRPGQSPLEVHVLKSSLDSTEHLAIVGGGTLHNTTDVVTHIIFESTVQDILGGLSSTSPASSSSSPTPSTSLQSALDSVAQTGGIVLYIRGQQQRKISLAQEVLAMHWPPTYTTSAAGGLPVFSPAALFTPDVRDYSVCMQALRLLGVQSICLPEQNASHTEALLCCGVKVRVASSNSNGVAASSMTEKQTATVA